MKTHVIYPRSNQADVTEIRRHLGFHKIPVYEPYMLSINEARVEVPAVPSFGDQALATAQAYAEQCASQSKLRGFRLMILVDETGIEVPALNGASKKLVAPAMSDEEIIARTLDCMRKLKGFDRNALLVSKIVLIGVNTDGSVGEPFSFRGTLEGNIRIKPTKKRIKGNPFSSIFHATLYNMPLVDFYGTSNSHIQKGILSHRGRALEEAVPVISELMAN